MAITIATLSEVVADLGGSFRTRFPTKGQDRDSYFGKLSRSVAMGILGFLKAARDVSLDMVPNYSMSDLAADLWAYAVGVVSNDPAVKWGRNSATPAAGGQGTVFGVFGAVVPDGTQLTDPTGQVIIKTSGALVVGILGSVTATLVAVTKGPSGNLPKGTKLTFVSPPANVEPTIELTVALLGGLARESTVALVSRIFRAFQDPKRGGAAADFRRWCENYLDSNGVAPGHVARSYGYPLRGGAGTFHSVIAGPGSGVSRLLGAGVQSAVQSHVNTVRPATSQHTTLLPNMVSGTSMQMEVTPSAPRYAYDWYDASTPTAIFSLPAANQITINVDINTAVQYATLKAALTAGRNPRLQILALNSPLPVVVRAGSYSVAAGRTTFTILDTPQVVIGGVTTPVTLQVGDFIYAGGPVVTPVAQRLLALIDNLGPSRAGGYADPSDPWDDTLRVGAMIDTALETLDPTDGKTKMLKDVLPVATLIDGSSRNKQAKDIGVGGSPELLYAQWIVVLGPV